MSRTSPPCHQNMDVVNAGSEPWEWQDDIQLQSDSPLDISHCLWEELNESGKDSWCVFDEATPIKDYAGFDCPVSSFLDEVVTEKEMEDRRSSSSQLKRRRMLQFSSETACVLNENASSAFVKSKIREESLIEESGDVYLSNAVPEDQLWASHISERGSPGQSPDRWMMECFNDQEMQISSDDINNCSGVSEEQLKVSDFCNMPPETEMDARQDFATEASHTYLTGSSFPKIAMKATTVAYPFTLVKPCGVQGGVTLKDINQRILMPPASKSKHKKNKEALPSYPTSAFSGKPVVALTKVHTEGGKGSITIMKTKG
ncbi:protein XRI1-like isoform X3 [Nymphaea colorata]|uniref:protein XRI1-like isoform X3 n=1 Tax=Nymphaea colorata TaxID=210225 RepID=UPI00129D9BF0|nr:protein XRI1-like isoform X3 [Nymphaea colorata]